MRTVDELIELAVGFKGDAAAVEALMPTVKSAEDVKAVSDDRILALMARGVFQAGFSWKVIDKKWPGFEEAKTFEWGGAVDENGFSSTEQSAFDTLELETDASQAEIKTQYRKLAKQFHPDANPGDPEAAERFYKIQTAYDLLREKSPV